MKPQMTEPSAAKCSTMEGNLQKKRIYSYSGDEDKLSSLPDDIIHDILCRLPFESAVATGILSRRWFGLWKELKSLRVNSNLVPFGSYRRFYSVIDHVLHQLSSTQIEAFDFHFSLPVRKVELELFKLLIQQICHRHVKKLKVTFTNPNYNRSVLLPSIVLESQQLEVLILGLSLSYQLPQNGVNLPRLRKLCICICDSNIEFASKLVKSCPVLKDLHILGGLQFYMPLSLHICAPNLKSLSVIMTYHKILIDAPKLEKIYVKDCLNLSKYSFVRNPNRLQTVVANTRCTTGKEEWQFVKSIGNVRSLVFQGKMYCAFYHMNDYGLPKFDVLTNLELVLQFPVFWKALARFLQFCPNLKTLTLMRTKFTWYGTGWIELDIVPTCLSSNVKRILLKNFHEEQQEMELIRYILMVAKVLERLHVTVVVPNSVKPTSLQLSKKPEFSKGLYRLPKSSSVCQISVTYWSISS